MSTGPVLIVEDNGTTRKMMRLALQAEGYAVIEAGDGATALRLAAQHSPVIVLLDCKLPDMDGFEVGRRLHALSPGLPVVAVTGWAQVEEARVLGAGFLDLLLKPVEPSRLVEIVRQHVGQAVPPRQHHGTVLVADDDPTQRKLAQLSLTGAGFEVVVAEDGEAALRLARAHPPTVILSDVLMPRLDGFALCRAIRSESALAHIPIVLMSAHYLEDEDRALAQRFGATRYVSRTAGFEVVVRAVVDAIDAPAATPAVPPSDEIEADYLRRIAHQLERQASIGAGFARRVSMQATALTVLDGLSDSLARQLDPESALDQTLAQCLDAAGLSVGTILLKGANGQLTVKAHLGSAKLDWGSHADVLSLAVAIGGLVIPSREAGRGGDALLDILEVRSALIVPIVARDDALGVLLLASSREDLAGIEGESFARAARSVSTQLGQALALGRMFSKLTAAEQRYRALFDNAVDAIGVMTPQGVIEECNERFARLGAMKPEQLVGRSLSEFAPPGRREELQTEFEEAVAQGGGPVPLVTFRKPDGSIIHVETTQTVINVGGERRVLSIGRDVTERHGLEVQLRQAQKMEAVGQLAGGIAHDFNNVLSVILSYAGLLLSEMTPGDPMREDIEEIRMAGKRAADLTRQLLMFSRQQLLEPRVLDLNEVLTSVDKMLQRILGADVDLVSVPAPALGRVRVDPSSMEQVIMNLVVNARDAMPTGGKLTMETANVQLDEVFAQAHLGTKAGPHVMLAVTDTGTGMDRATQTRIFEPFFTTKERGKGTGLGLSTVFGIVQQSGGSIWVYSEVGQGTTFKVYLPRVDAPVDAARVLEPPTTQRGSETILLVEDDDQVRTVARGILQKRGYNILEGRNAGEALLLAERHSGPIQLLLSDVVMPQLSGPELAKRLASTRPDMKVLCMSGYTDDSIVRHGVLEGKVAFLQKPFTPEALAARVREVLDSSERPTTKGD